MIICPECRNLYFDQSHDKVCNWRIIKSGGLYNFLSLEQRDNQDSDKYINNYEELGKKNVVKSNIDRKYLNHQASNLITYIGRDSFRDATICDVGIGQGFFAQLALRAEARFVCGVDISTTYLHNLPNNERIIPILANAENLPFINSFDIVITTDVMEHVINIGSFLYCLNNMIKPGGVLAIRVPYRENLIKYSPHEGYAYDYGHLRSFNKSLILDLVTYSGFTPVSWHLNGFGLGMPNEFWLKTDWRRSAYSKIQRVIQNRVMEPTVVTTYPSWIAKTIMRPNEIVCVCRKTHMIVNKGGEGLVLERYPPGAIEKKEYDVEIEGLANGLRGGERPPDN